MHFDLSRVEMAFDLCKSKTHFFTADTYPKTDIYTCYIEA